MSVVTPPPWMNKQLRVVTKNEYTWSIRTPKDHEPILSSFKSVILETCELYMWHVRTPQNLFPIYSLFLMYNLV